jgi:DNA-binding XRE family transcriptional regulator
MGARVLSHFLRQGGQPHYEQGPAPIPDLSAEPASADGGCALSELPRLRNMRGLTQEDLAVLTGMTHGAISRIEHGERRPRPETVVKLAHALRVSATRLNAALPDAPLEDEPAAPLFQPLKNGVPDEAAAS